MSIEQKNKELVLEYYQALENANQDNVANVLAKYMSDDCHWHGVHPFNEQTGPQAVAKTLWQPLMRAFKSIQRRQDVFIAGVSGNDGANWVTSMGHFMALFDNDWLGIPRSRKVVMIRYADFNNIEEGKIVRSGFFL